LPGSFESEPPVGPKKKEKKEKNESVLSRTHTHIHAPTALPSSIESERPIEQESKKKIRDFFLKKIRIARLQSEPSVEQKKLKNKKKFSTLPGSLESEPPVEPKKQKNKKMNLCVARLL